ncbi:MAG: hypothetical protein PHC39_04685 [Proteiniphilum sp.]|nr:hypothetical protein [Proteiniphilum sp.]
MKKNCLVGLKYPAEISGVFRVGGIEIEGVYRVHPCGGYEITDRHTGFVVSAGTRGAEELVHLIREHTPKESMLISVSELVQIIKNAQKKGGSNGS